MYIADQWKEYTLLDAGGGERLERWGDYVFLRPDPQAIWPLQGGAAARGVSFDAHYIRSSAGGGHWEYARPLPESWHIRYGSLTFLIRPTGFKHMGLFPEQAANWDWLQTLLQKRPGARVLNVFAYTGGATCAAASAGAHVTHVDAAKGMVQWAKNNLALCGLDAQPVRFLVDDAMKFVLREQRRGSKYDGIIMDPPSYGRGPDGELWKLEQNLYPMIEAAVSLLSDRPLFFLISSYTTGLAPSVLRCVLQSALQKRNPQIEAAELGLPIESGRGFCMPCGAAGRARWL